MGDGNARISQFAFLDYRVKHVSLDIADGFGSAQEKLRYDLKNTYVIDSDDRRLVSVSLELVVTSESTRVNFRGEIVGRFRGDPDMTETVFEHMYSFNAPAILLPYARALLSTYSVLGNIPPIIFPLINFQPAKTE